MMPLRILGVATLVLLAAPASAKGPSFDCRKAAGADERAICRSALLSAQDRQLSRDYNTVLGCLGMGSRDAERDIQAEWLRRRAACGGSTACIGKLYRQRLAELKPRAAKARRYMAETTCPGPV